MFSASWRGYASIARALSKRVYPSCPVRRFPPPQAYLSSTVGAFPIPKHRSFHISCPRLASAATATSLAPEAETGENEQDGIVTQFAELASRGMVSRSVVDALTQNMRLVTMTPVQSQTINETLKGDDVLAQARTGTGKTVAFLVPVLQKIIAQDPSLENHPAPPGRRRYGPDIRALIISPTRELAEQIATEARKVTTRTNVIVQTAVGGTGKRFALQKIQNEGCHILVGTPGRLNDVLSDPRSGIEIKDLDVLVLDEADRLLDDGFAPELLNIKRLLPSNAEDDYQTLMFSATVPEEVMQMVRRFMKPGYRFVRTVQPGEQATHERVPQRLVHVNGLENMLPSVLELMQRELARTDAELPFKAIVFFNANAEACLAADIFRRIGRSTGSKIPIIEMHSKLSQYERTRASEDFRRAKSAVMFSSDVTSRGMDFPNVTHVIQLHLPRQAEQYVHRLGRTARGDKNGEGWLFVAPIERRDVALKFSNMPLVQDTTLLTAKVDMTQDSQLPANVTKCLTDVIEASKIVDPELKKAAYKANLGVFQGYSNKTKLVKVLNQRAKHAWGMETPPALSPSLLRKINFAGVPGLNVSADEERPIFPNSNFGKGRSGAFGGNRRRFSDRMASSSFSERAPLPRQPRGNTGYRQRY